MRAGGKGATERRPARAVPVATQESTGIDSRARPKGGPQGPCPLRRRKLRASTAARDRMAARLFHVTTDISKGKLPCHDAATFTRQSAPGRGWGEFEGGRGTPPAPGAGFPFPPQESYGHRQQRYTARARRGVPLPPSRKLRASTATLDRPRQARGSPSPLKASADEND